MALEIDNQYDFFQNVQLDDDGNLLVSIINNTGATGNNYYTTGATLAGTVVTFDRTDTTNAYSVDLSSIAGGGSGNYLPLTGGTITGITFQFIEAKDATPGTPDYILDGGSGATLDFEVNMNGGTVASAGEPAGHHPYKVDLLSSGNAYTFSGGINVLSIGALTEATTVTLPTSPLRDFYVVKDKTGNAGTYPITVTSGIGINGDGDYIINLGTKPSITFLYDGESYITI